MTHDEIKTELNGNHGSCLGILNHLIGENLDSYAIKVAVSRAKIVLEQHDSLVLKQRELWADESVDQDKWRGDECGYLAAQCKARTLRGLIPTAEQKEAWLHENTNAVELFKGAI